mgnify:CR=1 FL=1
MIEKKRQSGLGRGLSALLDEVSSSTADRGTTAAQTRLPLAQIVANPQQPRRQFDAAAMDELVASVRERGLLQPILVRPLGVAAMKSSPANAAGAPRRRRNSMKCRWWCATSMTARRSKSR